MLVKVIGGHGGKAPGFRTTSYLVDGKLLIDAGSVAEGLPVDEQAQIDNILISHPHLDHISDLAFLCDNCFGKKEKPFEVYSNKITHNAIKSHIMNNVIWPDFSVIPNAENPTINFNIIESEQMLRLGEYEIMPVQVNHPCKGYGFIVSKDDSSVIFTQDTATTERIWEVAKSFKNLRAIFTEVSFPNSMQDVADMSLHHTSNTLKAEIPKMPPNIPIFLGHLKPGYQATLYKEIEEIGCSRISLLGSDNSNYVV